MIAGGGHCTRWEGSTLDFGNDGEGGEDDDNDDGGEKDGNGGDDEKDDGGEKDGDGEDGEKYDDGEQPGKRAGDSKLMRRWLKWDFRHLHNNDFKDQDQDGVDYQDVDQMKRNKSCCFYFGRDIMTFVS